MLYISKVNERKENNLMKYALVLVILCVMICSASCSYAWEMSIDNYAGGALYQESDSATGTEVRSDWKAFVYKYNIAFSKYDNQNVQGEIFYGMAVTSKATETWNINGTEYQTNDMSFWGLDTGLAIGWAFPIKISEEVDIALTPLVGYRWKFERFTRSNFVILRRITITETVDEDYSIHTIDVGGRVNFKFNEHVDFFIKPIFGIVFYNGARNSVLGTIDGTGGFLFDADAGISYSITENFIIGAAFRMELQRLDGGTKGNMIWPDNQLDMYGGTLTVKYKF